MQWNARSSLLAALALAAPAQALLRFGCAQLVVQRLDPLVQPGANPSAHLHQIIGGNSFNVTMTPVVHDLAKLSTCTTCQFSEDFSNYWTAVLFYRAANGTYKRVRQQPNVGFEGTRAGMTVYYMQDALFDVDQPSNVTAFKPGFRMLTGDPTFRTKKQAGKFRQITYTCLDNPGTRFPETQAFPAHPCKAGIMASLRFPTCWDGKNLDSPNHQDHISYPATGTFESGGDCPDTHPVRLPQLMYETIWDTTPFNDPSLWPEDGSQPFVWSMGDVTGYASHGDYMFGWKDDALQRAMDSNCYVNCPTLKTQSIEEQNKCSVPDSVGEDIDSWLTTLPGVESSMTGMNM
ncbi:hypothetical protein SPI_01561 [Niveomyces insectorum RCEF 264]|uniref:DUF1996 domain-containing protein n=1 Tax=Niveomyces insectorum RCEF 264 TaxID=1081102 RepID=A0A167Z277_9HYPO|nr:hypothetical protein SPI_01561 [Niveomyces insectorum RCEF 264]